MGLLCQEECPSITEYGTPCSGHGTCARSGACTCEVARTMVKYTQNTRQVIKNEAGKPLISFTGQDSLKMEERTGWRGDGCELMCPGYDAFEADMTGICSGHGQCTADAKCTCEIGYTGENCQLDCPNTKKLKVQCSGHGVCQPNTFNVTSVTSGISAQLTNWICTKAEQTLNTVTINGHTVSELQFYENVESTSTEYMDADGKVFTVGTKKITPSVMLEEDKKYPVRIVGSGVTLVHDEFPRVGPNCESTMITNPYKIRPQIEITRYNDEENDANAPVCPKEEEVKQTCDVMSKDTLQCAMCACPPTMYNGFWGGSDCRTCMPGYGGTHCKDSCPGFDGTDIKTACGVGTCSWGSTNGEGTKFRVPKCACGNPDVYEYCDLYVDGTAVAFPPEGTHFKDTGGAATCSCQNGYSGLLCDKAMPSCLFGGDPQPEGGCTCQNMTGWDKPDALSNDHSCCPKGLDDTALQSITVPTYLTDSMTYTGYTDLNILESVYADKCKATCPYGGDETLDKSDLWDYIYTNQKNGTGTEFQQCSGHGTCSGEQCECDDNWHNSRCSCQHFFHYVYTTRWEGNCGDTAGESVITTHDECQTAVMVLKNSNPDTKNNPFLEEFEVVYVGQNMVGNHPLHWYYSSGCVGQIQRYYFYAPDDPSSNDCEQRGCICKQKCPTPQINLNNKCSSIPAIIYTNITTTQITHYSSTHACEIDGKIEIPSSSWSPTGYDECNLAFERTGMVNADGYTNCEGCYDAGTQCVCKEQCQNGLIVIDNECVAPTVESIYDTAIMNTYRCEMGCKDDGGCGCMGGYKQDGQGCTLCPVGRYQSEENRPTCTECPEGHYTNTLIFKGATTCTPCGTGMWTPNTGEICRNCPQGYYQDTATQNSCKLCNSGKFQDARGQSSCLSCAAGQYQDQKHQSYCKSDCGAGSSINNAKTSCSGCAAGRYQDENSKTGCKSCVGMSKSGSGATGCTACSGGTPYVNFAKTACIGCSAGAYPASTGCTECAAGKKSTANQASCTACIAGQYTNDHKTCYGCPEGYHSGVGASSCTICAAGTRWVSYTSTGYPPCISCPKDTYQSQAGQSTLCKGCTNSDNAVGCTGYNFWGCTGCN